MFAHQQLGGLIHGVDVERTAVDHHVAAERVGPTGAIGQRVGVAPPGRRVPSVEADRCDRDRGDPQVVRQEPPQPGHQVCGGVVPDRLPDIDVSDLSPGMNPGVGPAGDDQGGGRSEP